MALVVIIAIILFIIILTLLIILIIIDQNNQDGINTKIKTSKTLDDMIKMAKDISLSKDKLKELAIIFINTQKLDIKKTKQIDEDIKHKLNFVSALASNKNADAKLISFLSNELIKRYKEYTTEINTYEKMGLARRNSKDN